MRHGVHVSSLSPGAVSLSGHAFAVLPLFYDCDPCWVLAFKQAQTDAPPQSMRTLAALDFQPNCIALSSSRGLLVAGGRHAKLQFTTFAPPTHPSLARRRTRASQYGSVERSFEKDEDLDEEEVDESMGWSMDGAKVTRTRRVEIRGAGGRNIARMNNHVLILGNNDLNGGIYGQGKRGASEGLVLMNG